jgi:hypothetical protein
MRARRETETVSFIRKAFGRGADEDSLLVQGSFDGRLVRPLTDLGRRRRFFRPVQGSGTGEGTGGLSYAEDSATCKRGESDRARRGTSRRPRARGIA